MKYAMLFVETEEFHKAMAAMNEAERQAAFEAVGQWFARYEDKITYHAHLKPQETATTLRRGNGMPGGDPIVTSGPFVAGAEMVSGFVELDVADLDEALAIAEAWPGCPTVEIRPAD